MADPMYFQPPVDAYVFPTSEGSIRLPDGSIDPISRLLNDRIQNQAFLQPVTMSRSTEPSRIGGGDTRPPFEVPYRQPVNPRLREYPIDYYRMSAEMGVPVFRSGEGARQSRISYPTNENTPLYGDRLVPQAQEYDVNYQYAMDRLDKAREKAGLGPAPRNMYQDDFVNARRYGLPLEVTKLPEEQVEGRNGPGSYFPLPKAFQDAIDSTIQKSIAEALRLHSNASEGSKKLIKSSREGK